MQPGQEKAVLPGSLSCCCRVKTAAPYWTVTLVPPGMERHMHLGSPDKLDVRGDHLQRLQILLSEPASSTSIQCLHMLTCQVKYLKYRQGSAMRTDFQC